MKGPARPKNEGGEANKKEAEAAKSKIIGIIPNPDLADRKAHPFFPLGTSKFHKSSGEENNIQQEQQKNSKKPNSGSMKPRVQERPDPKTNTKFPLSTPCLPSLPSIPSLSPANQPISFS